MKLLKTMLVIGALISVNAKAEPSDTQKPVVKYICKNVNSLSLYLIVATPGVAPDFSFVASGYSNLEACLSVAERANKTLDPQ